MSTKINSDNIKNYNILLRKGTLLYNFETDKYAIISKYITENRRKIYGLFLLNKKKEVYYLEKSLKGLIYRGGIKIIFY